MTRRRPKVTALSRPGAPPPSVRRKPPVLEVRFGIHRDKDPNTECRQPGCDRKLRRGKHITGLCGRCRNALPPVLKVGISTRVVAQRHAQALLDRLADGDRHRAAELAGLSPQEFDAVLAGEWPTRPPIPA